MRDGRWKLLCEQDGSRAELYDLDADPGETKNLADQQAELVRKLTTAVRTWDASMPKGIGPTGAARPQ